MNCKSEWRQGEEIVNYSKAVFWHGCIVERGEKKKNKQFPGMEAGMTGCRIL
jgi:hypothetical protein